MDIVFDYLIVNDIASAIKMMAVSKRFFRPELHMFSAEISHLLETKPTYVAYIITKSTIILENRINTGFLKWYDKNYGKLNFDLIPLIPTYNRDSIAEIFMSVYGALDAKSHVIINGAANFIQCYNDKDVNYFESIGIPTKLITERRISRHIIYVV